MTPEQLARDMLIVNDLSGLWRKEMMRHLARIKVKPEPTPARNRTRSARALAGSRRNKRHPIARTIRDSDWVNYGHPNNRYDIGAPNHAARFQDVRAMFPLAPGQKEPVKRWP